MTRCFVDRQVTRALALAFAVIAAASCAGEPEDVGAVRQGSHIAPPSTALNTFITSYLEIDQLAQVPGPCGPPCLDPDDANLVLGTDVSGSASVQIPAGPGGAVYVDWHGLAVADPLDHFVVDEDAADGKDLTAFPGSNHCVGKANVPGKEDVRYISAANNTAFVYFGALRRTNSGDSVLVWILTVDSPILGADGAAPCSSRQQPLSLHIEPTSRLVRMHFHPGTGSPIMQLFTGAAGADDVVDAVAAANFEDTSLWVPGADLAAAAVNTSITQPGAFGAAGAGSLDASGNLLPWMFVEGAFPISAFGGDTCAVTYNAAIIDLSSGSGGPNPDLKDVVFARFNFGSPSATAQLTATCGPGPGFDLLTAVGADGATPIASPTCSWQFFQDSSVVGTATSCDGNAGLSPGTYTATLTVSDPANPSCTAVVNTGPITTFAPLSVDLDLGTDEPTCATPVGSDQVTYDAVVSGGAPPYTYAWRGCAGPACTLAAYPTCAGASCQLDSSAAFCFDRSLAVVVDDASLCPPVTSETERYQKTTTFDASEVP